MEILDNIKKDARANYIPILSDECEEVLINLIKESKPKKILEIGTCIGYSSTLMLLNSDAVVDTIEINEDRLNRAKELWTKLNIIDRVNYNLGDANIILDDVIKDKEYDFVFIDGPKSWYLLQFNKCFNNVKKGGIILADDILFFGLVEGEEKVKHKHRTIVRHLREFVSFIKTNEDIELNILKEGNGIAIMRKK